MKRALPYCRQRHRKASDPKLLARVDRVLEAHDAVRAGKACYPDIHREIRAAVERGDRVYAVELARDVGLFDEFINGQFEEKA
jgi:hypothetical protein